ncbi:MAG TPA: sodium:solute symporter family protein [Candidatus Dormibacteraeota bacterium]|nr:sodium:solute symporter family protein [Candidatus Dormibacteraeota bacterium]
MRAALALVIAVGAIALGVLLAARGRRIDIREWAVGGRRFGAVLYWFLSVGEVFTTFALLGAVGFVYAYGAPAYYILGPATLSAALGYWLLPRIWLAGRRHDLLTQGDYFAARFGSPWFGAVLAVAGIVALLPYLQVQLTGLALIVGLLLGTPASQAATYVVLAGAAAVAFVLFGGMRSVAFSAIVKDVLLIGVLLVLVAGIGAVVHAGSPLDVFGAAARRYPAAATLPGRVAALRYNDLWFMSTLLLSPLSAWTFPHAFQTAYTASGPGAVRRNLVFQPLYSLMYVLLFVLGLAALLAVPGLKNSNAALVALVGTRFPGWVAGLLAGTGVLVALIPSAVILLACASLLSRNVYRVAFPRASDSTLLLVSRLAVVAFAAIAVAMSVQSGQTIVAIFISALSAVSQLFPSILLSFTWRRITGWGAIAGLLTGGVIVAVGPIATVVTTSLGGLLPAIPALAANVLVTVVVSLLTPAPSAAAVAVGIEPGAPGDDGPIAVPAGAGT